MSQPNVEIVRRGYEALRAGGVDAIVAFLDPDFEMHIPPEISPEPEVVHGHDGVRRWFDLASEVLEEILIEPEEFIDAGDRVVVPVRIIGRGRGSGAEAEQRVTQVWTLRDGLSVRMETYVDKASALDALGLPKDNMELVRAGFDAWNRDDLDAWLRMVHPDVEFLTSGVFPDLDDVYRGHAGMARFWRVMHDPWEELRIDPERIADRGDRLAVLFRFRARGAGSGADVDLRFGNAYRLRDGLILEMVARRTFEEALEVAGLTEQDVASRR